MYIFYLFIYFVCVSIDKAVVLCVYWHVLQSSHWYESRLNPTDLIKKLKLIAE